MNLSSALEYSSRSPVSVYGTGFITRFSWKRYQLIITAAEALVYYQCHNNTFNVLFRQYAEPTSFRHFYRYESTGILTCCPSTTPIRIRVRTRLTLS